MHQLTPTTDRPAELGQMRRRRALSTARAVPLAALLPPPLRPVLLPPRLALCALVSCALVGWTAGCTELGGQHKRDQLQVSKVVLYQNGVGYFERRGEVKGRKIELRVRPDQINDVLKSLSVLKRGGGRASSVTLPVERSSDRLAAELPEQVRNARGLLGLLQVLRGVEVTIETADADKRGRVVGVEGRAKAAKVTLMQGEQRLVVLPVQAITKVRIHDKALATGLARSLDISKNDGQWKPVSVTLRFADKGPHDLLVSYILEVPVWRPAYRAWVEKGKGVRLSGWAVVDNVSGEDWRDVALSLVVGSPLSFRYNLHRPHHVRRPDLSSRLASTAAAPPPADVGYDSAPRPSPPPRAMQPKPSSMAGFGSGGGGGMRSRGVSRKSFAPRARPMAPIVEEGAAPARDLWSANERRKAMTASAAALVTGRKVGALYRYDALEPVTVPDGQAALIPIVDRLVPGEDVFLFRSVNATAPYRAVLLRNVGGKSTKHGGDLETGPITLYVGGTFAGEGFLGRVAKGATAFVPYAQESGLAVSRSYQSKDDETRLVKAVAGRITIEGKQHRIRTFTVTSERDEPSVVYVKMKKTHGYTMENPPTDIVRAGADLFLRIAVPAKSTGKLVLTEVRPMRQTTVTLSHMVLTAFRLYLTDAKAEDAVKGPIRELLAVNEQLGQLANRRMSLYRQRNELATDARRIRRNLDSLPPGNVAAKLRRQLVKQLEDNSRQAALVAKGTVELEVERATLQPAWRCSSRSRSSSATLAAT